MKKNIVRLFCGCLLGCGIAAATVSCSDNDYEPTLLSDLKVSSSYVGISQDGGSNEITVTASGEWAFVEQTWIAGKDTTVAVAPSWLTVSTVSGAAGTTTVTFTAESSLNGRTCELLIGSRGQNQHINIIQGLSTVSNATCAEVIAGPDSKSYRVTGTVTRIVNTDYGNWYLEDETGEIYIYGTRDKSGNNGKNSSIAAWGIDVGDVITIEGPKTTYNGTVELVDVTVINITKALLKIESPEANVGIEGGNVEVKVSYKGNGAFCSIADDAKSWVNYEGARYIAGEEAAADTAVFRFNVLPNTAEGRKAEITFSSYSGATSTEIAYTIKQAAYALPHGQSAEDPFTVAEAIAKCQQIGATSDGEIYFAKGRISSIKEVSTSYGNATFNISDDGTDANALTCFRSLFLDNQKFTDENAIAVGDVVVVCGKLVNYTKDDTTTPEFSGNVYIVSLKKGDAPAEAGTLDNPFTPAQANAFCQSLGEGNTSEKDVYVKGKIIEITDNNQFGTQYGNCTFYLSDDGTDKADKFYVFRTLYLGNVKYSDDSWLKPKAGDEVIVCGKLTLYKDKNGNLVPETSAGKSYIYSLNGKTK